MEKSNKLVRLLLTYGTRLSITWAVIEFLIFLLKNGHQFNWWSVWAIIIFLLLVGGNNIRNQLKRKG